jgi:hypothetical protein
VLLVVLSHRISLLHLRRTLTCLARENTFGEDIRRKTEKATRFAFFAFGDAKRRKQRKTKKRQKHAVKKVSF